MFSVSRWQMESCRQLFVQQQKARKEPEKTDGHQSEWPREADAREIETVPTRAPPQARGYV